MDYLNSQSDTLYYNYPVEIPEFKTHNANSFICMTILMVGNF
jgi:hypothetical protein